MNMIVHRVSPQQARYTPAGGREKCSFCRFYIAPKWCGHVTGPVSPMGWCKYFSQEMRAQFGGSQATGAGMADPTFDIDFMNSTLGAGAVFTRASTGWSTNSNGVLVSATNDTPRFDYDPATLALNGVLIENTATNLLTQSSVGVAPWQGLNNVVALPVGTANQTAAPDGTTTGTRIVFPAVSGANAYSFWFQQATVTAVPYVFSVWLKGNAGGEQTYLEAQIGGTLVSSPRLILTTQWQRFVFVTPALTAGFWALSIGTDLRDVTQASTPAQTIFAWGAQLELNYVSSYIPTTAATVTRAADALSYPIASVTGFSAAAGSLMLEYDAANTGQPLGGFSDGSTANMFYFQQNGAVATYVASANKAFLVSPVAPFPGVNKIAGVYQPNRLSGAINGGAVGVDGTLAAGPFLWTTRLAVGCSPWGLDSQMGGHMRRLRYWPRALSNGELQAVTS